MCNTQLPVFGVYLHQDLTSRVFRPLRSFLRLGLLLLFFIGGSAVAHAGEKDKSGVSPQVISLPSGPGSLEGLGESFDPNLNTGTASYPVKFTVAPGVVGFQPEPALNYDGGNANGPWGLGWKINIPFIQRQTDEGLPSYLDSADHFVYSNGEKLVALANGDYRFENEGTFLRFRRLPGDDWEAHAPDGTRYLFGESATARESNDDHIFCWKLERQIDPHGNQIHYFYLQDGGYAYPQEIRYNFSRDGRYNAIVFHYEPRVDIFTDRRSRFPIAINWRGTDIEIQALGKRVRLYRFAYVAEQSTGMHSLLHTITQIGMDGASTLPPYTFTYTQFDPTNYAVVSMQNPPPIGLNNADADLVDINADGLPDVVYTPSSGHRFYLNRGNGRWQLKPIDQAQLSGDRLSSPNARIADMNGDGQADFLIKAGNTPHAPFFYYAGQRDNFWDTQDPIHYNVTPSFKLNDPNLQLFDANNDKRVDMMLTTNNHYHIWLAKQDNGWNSTADISVPAVAVGTSLVFENPHVKLGDMTGDRIQDLVFVRDGLVVYFPHNGNGDYAQPVTMGNPPHDLDNLAKLIQLGDINNDGLADLVLAGHRQVRYWLNLGNHRLADAVVLTGTPDYDQAHTAVRLADMDGDGVTELLFSPDPALTAQPPMQYVDFFTGTQPLLLSSIDNGLGRTIHIEYKPSTAFYVADWNKSTPWTTALPFPVQVVSRVTVHDANSGDNYTIDYTYRDGYYDGEQKEFRGFARTQMIQYGDETAATTITDYLYDTGIQEESRKGFLLEKDVLGEGGLCADTFVGCYLRETNLPMTRLLYDEGSDHQVAYSFVAQTDTFIHENQNTPVQLRQHFDRDEFGNLTQEFNYGQVCTDDVTCGHDEVLKYTEYAYNVDAWIVNRPSHIRQMDAADNLVREARFYYDGDAYRGLPLGEVTRGDLARQEENLGPLGDNRFIPTKRQAFDANGNIIGIMDGNGHVTTVHYDNLTHTFPVLESVQLAQSRALTYTAAYDIGFGKIISATEFNGNTTLFTYDTFGRITSIVRPGDTLTLPTQQFSYTLHSPRSSITTYLREQVGTNRVRTSVVYFDGLGRKLQTRSEAENGQTIVADAITFNARQGVSNQFLPYFASDFAYQPPTSNLPHSSKQYDPLARVVRTINADGSFATVEFQPLLEIQSDEEDNHPGSPYMDTPKLLRYDGLNRLVEVVESNRVSSITGLTETERISSTVENYHTAYRYDALGNLTMITDSQGNTKTIQYDALSRKVFMDDPDRGTMRYRYDDAGNLQQTTDAKGQVITYTYDAANRPLTELWSTSDSTRPVFTYHYDADLSSLHPDARNTLGQVTYIEDPEGALYFSYDDRGNVAGRIRSFTKEGFSFVTRMSYDDMDRLRELTYPDGYTVTYHYNAQGLLDAIPDYVANIDYTPSGQRAVITYTNGVTTRYDYDIRLRLKHLQTTTDQHIIQNLAYDFDQVSNIIAITDSRTQRTNANDQTQRFGYDSLYRLTQVAGTYGEIDYAYNSIGNMVHQSSTIGDTRLNIGEMRYGEGNAGPHALTFADDESYLYDANGNQLGKGRAIYRWNLHNWLNTVSNEETISTYAYDGYGQRIRQTVTHNSVITTTLYPSPYLEVHSGRLIHYIFDNQHLIAQVTTNFESSHLRHNFKDPVTTSLTVSQEFVSNTLWYLSDHLGSTNILIDEQGQKISEEVYYPYGLTRYVQNGNETRYQFVGKELDESGLYYFDTRYYDPVIAQFVSPDAWYVEQPELDLYNLNAFNIYIYGRGNPIKYIDPDGRDVNGALLDEKHATPIGDTGEAYMNIQVGMVSNKFQGVTDILKNTSLLGVESEMSVANIKAGVQFNDSTKLLGTKAELNIRTLSEKTKVGMSEGSLKAEIGVDIATKEVCLSGCVGICLSICASVGPQLGLGASVGAQTEIKAKVVLAGIKLKMSIEPERFKSIAEIPGEVSRFLTNLGQAIESGYSQQMMKNMRFIGSH